jgi:hypothetical protein
MGWPEKMVADAINNPSPLLRELDAENDEIAVRERLSAGKYNTWQSEVVNEWLRRKSEEKQSAFDARLEAREDAMLSATKEANRIASRAERWAMYAAITAVIALIIAITNKMS